MSSADIMNSEPVCVTVSDDDDEGLVCKLPPVIAALFMFYTDDPAQPKCLSNSKHGTCCTMFTDSDKS